MHSLRKATCDWIFQKRTKIWHRESNLPFLKSHYCFFSYVREETTPLPSNIEDRYVEKETGQIWNALNIEKRFKVPGFFINIDCLVLMM